MSGRYILCLTIALASGAAALSHELLWTRRLVDILGATGEATSLVLGCFFFGLSVGAAVASRFVDRISAPWKALALVEVVIALLTIPAAMLPHLTEWIWPALGPEALVSWPGKCVKLTVSTLVVVPPAVAMGMTLPILIVAIEKTITENQSAKVLVYAFNTLGGALGLLVTSVWLLGAFGVFGSMMVAMVTNVLIALAAWSLRPRASGVSKSRRKKKAQTALNTFEPLSRRTRLIMAAFSGCIVLAMEVVAIRLLSLTVPSSFQATSAVLLSVLLLLGVAALLVPLLIRIVPSPRWQLLFALSLSAIGAALSPDLLLLRTEQLVDVTSLAALDGRSLNGALDFQLSVLSVALGSIGPAILLAGMVFPLLLASATRDSTSSTGRHWAILLAVNGIGGLLGAIIAEYSLIPWLGIYRGMLLIAAVQAVVAIGAAVALSDWKLLAPAAVAALACLAIYPRVNDMPYVTPRSKYDFVVEDTLFGKDGVCLIVTTEQHGRSILMNNQYVLGSTAAFDEQRRQVLIPMLLHGRPANAEKNEGERVKRVCCLGLATGTSAGAALDFDDLCHVTAVELSPMVVDAAHHYFERENRGFVTNPRATVIVEDARTYIASVQDAFDVIAGDLYRPYGAGEGRLYAREHFQNIYRALRPGGIYCQWIPAYQVTEEHFNIIAATFREVFEDAALLRLDSDSGHPQLGLMGTKNANISWDNVEKRCRELAARDIDDKDIQDVEFLKSVYVGQLSNKPFTKTPINTLNNALLEITAGLHRATYDLRSPGTSVGRKFYLRGENWKDFSSRLSDLTLD